MCPASAGHGPPGTTRSYDHIFTFFDSGRAKAIPSTDIHVFMASPVSAPDVAVPEDTQHHMRIVAIFVIFMGSMIGVLLPVVFRTRKESLGFNVVKQIGTGVVLATGIVHVLPDANTALSDPALGEYC